jgi:hypothetical protein
VARKTIFVSDFSAKEIPDEKQSVQVVLRYADGRRGQVVADAHVDGRGGEADRAGGEAAGAARAAPEGVAMTRPGGARA